MASSEPTQVTGFGLTIPPGTRLNGIFEIERQIGAGGMGMVYRAHNVETGDAVAIKIVRVEMAGNEQVLALFRKEAAVLHRLLHDAIVRYYLFTSDPDIGRPYLATEFVDGTSLSDMGAIGRDDVLALADRLASGLQAAHDVAIFHRDISPDNVILPGRDVRKAKIIDFGIARAAAVGGGTVIGDQIAGKFDYMSPEQLGLYGGQVDARSDIYSLGIVLSEAVLGRGLGMGGSQLEVIEKRRKVPDLSTVEPRLRALLTQMLQPRPEDRIATMAAVAETARQIGSGSARVGGRSVLPRLVAGIGVLVLLGGGTWYLLGGPGGGTPPAPSAPPPLVRQSAQGDAAPPLLSRTAPDADRDSSARGDETTASADLAAPDTAPSLGDGQSAAATAPPADEVATAAADTAQQAPPPSLGNAATPDEATPPATETLTAPFSDDTAAPVIPPADETASSPTDGEIDTAAIESDAANLETAPADAAPSTDTVGTSAPEPATPDAGDEATPATPPADIAATAAPTPQDTTPPASDSTETPADREIETATPAPPAPEVDAATTTDAAPADTIETTTDAPADGTLPVASDLAETDVAAPPADETAVADAAGQETSAQGDGAATRADSDTETAALAPDTQQGPDEPATASTETPPAVGGETAAPATAGETRPDAGDLATADGAAPPADATSGAAEPDAPPPSDNVAPQADGEFETAALTPDPATTGDEGVPADGVDAQADSDIETAAPPPDAPQAGGEGTAPLAETADQVFRAAPEDATPVAARPDTGEDETATTPPSDAIESAALADVAAAATPPNDASQPPAVPDDSATQPVADNTETAMLAPTDDTPADDLAADASTPPKSAVAAFVDDAALGPCTFVELAREGPQSATIIAYGNEIPPFERFDAGFRETLGFSADINLRPVSDAQCPAVVLAEALKGGPPLALTLKNDILTPGGILAGTVTGVGDRAVHLYLVAGDGHLYGLAEMMEIDGDTATFGTVMAGTSDGPPQHLLIAVAADTLPNLEAKADGNRAIDLAALIDTLEGAPAASAALGYFKYGP
ncbi:MAG: hypothetical protein AcusKO_49720 [Acuticoccus sp.]